LGYKYEEFSEKNKEYLRKIEFEISKAFEMQEEAVKTISDNKINISTISKKIKCARGTIYNNVIFKEYIEERAKDYEKDDIVRMIYLKDLKIKELQEDLAKLHQRDVEFEELKRENKSLKQQIKERNKYFQA